MRCTVLIALALAGLGACRQAPDPWGAESLARMTLREKAGQLIAPALYTEADAPPARDTALARRFAAAGVGGIRLLPGASDVARRRIEAAQRASALPLLVIADLDRGVGGTLDGMAELPPPLALAPEAGEEAARESAATARALGINLVLLTAPGFPYASALPAPSSSTGDASFAAYARGLGEGGVLVGVRALSPGPAQEAAGPVLGWDRAAVEGLQLGLLRTLVGGGLAAVKPASVAIPSITRDSVPLPDNPAFVQGVLRRDLGFGGLVVEDLSPVTPLVGRYGPQEAAVRAVAAGADLLVGVDDPGATLDALLAAVAAGRISAARIDEAARRVFAAKARLALRPGVHAVADSADSAALRRAVPLDARAIAAHRQALTGLGAAPAEALRGCRRTVLVTVPGVEAPELSAALAGGIPGLVHLRTARVARRGPLTADTSFAGRSADCVVAAAFPGHRPAVADRVTAPIAWSRRRSPGTGPRWRTG